jgi:hypothetical protein
MTILDFGFGICLLQKPARSKGEMLDAELNQFPHNFVYFVVPGFFLTTKNTKKHENRTRAGFRKKDVRASRSLQAGSLRSKGSLRPDIF